MRCTNKFLSIFIPCGLLTLILISSFIPYITLLFPCLNQTGDHLIRVAGMTDFSLFTLVGERIKAGDIDTAFGLIFIISFYLLLLASILLMFLHKRIFSTILIVINAIVFKVYCTYICAGSMYPNTILAFFILCLIIKIIGDILSRNEIPR